MPWFKVPVQVWLEADDELTALETLIDEMPATGREHRLRMAEGGPAELLDDEQAQQFLGFITELEQAKHNADAGNLIADPDHPRLRFTPAAAAELAAAEAEAGLMDQ